MSRPRGTEAEVSALHAKLEDGVAVRGASGGLGFEKKSSKKQKAAGSSKAGKSAPKGRKRKDTSKVRTEPRKKKLRIAASSSKSTDGRRHARRSPRRSPRRAEKTPKGRSDDKPPPI